MEVNNYCKEDYNLPCTVIVTGDAQVDSDIDLSLLNMFSDDSTDYAEILPKELKDKIHGSSYMTLIYNQPDQKLYSYNKFIVKKPLTTEELEQLGNFVTGQWSDGAGEVFEQTPVMEYEGEEIFVSPWHENQKSGVGQVPIEIPSDHFWLGSIFDSPEKMMMYEDFMQDPIVYRRFVKMCEAKKIDIPEEATESFMLPIHKKDKNTGEILISSAVLKVFDQYQYAQNFLNTKEFPIGSAEHAIGKLMMLYPKFCDFMMSLSEDQEAGRQIHDIEGNYNKAVNEAIKYIEKDKELYHLYETHWLKSETPELEIVKEDEKNS